MKKKSILLFALVSLLLLMFSGCGNSAPAVNENIEELSSVVLKDQKGSFLTEYVVTNIAEKLESDSLITDDTGKNLESYDNYDGQKGTGSRFKDAESSNYYCDVYMFTGTGEATKFADYLSSEENINCITAGNVLLALDGNFSSDRINSYKAALTSVVKELDQKQQEKAVQESQVADIKSLSGSTLVDAKNKIQNYGYSVTYVHAQTGLDFTSNMDAYTDDELSKWVVTEVKSVDENKKTAQLAINTAENIANNEAATAAKTALESKLDPNYAWEAVEKYGDIQYPYGFKLHWIMGKLAQEPKDENTWFLKATVTVKNQYGTKLDGVCEAYVSGTTDNPQVTGFTVY
ncbi:hypothetical protein [Eubacterium callanderi]|uniref:hypothetical protein n=1 Tax=Eubacterium callanderi TaxID=53442 RepID=UPI001D14014C|nr:hypothetical protein [Eubacterium callanderi]MCC3401070.1 hypothetical protein [Eubacterium callanderi]